MKKFANLFLCGLAILVIPRFAFTFSGEPENVSKPNFAAWFSVHKMPYWQSTNGSSPTWEEMGPSKILRGWNGAENAGRITCLAIDPTDSSTIYAGAASGGIWKTDDAGTHWFAEADFAPSLSYGAITVSPFHHEEVFAGMGEPNNSGDSFQGAGFMRSLDGGNHWTLLASKLFLGQKFSRIVCSSDDEHEIFAATTLGIMQSEDEGETWKTLLKGDATDLVMNTHSPNQLMATLGFSSGSPANGVYKSEDHGRTWTKLTKDLPYPGTDLGRIQLGQCQSFPTVVYASLYSHGNGIDGLMKTEDFGESWVRLSAAPSYAGGSAWYYNVVAVSSMDPNAVFLCGTSTYRSLDGGLSWEDNTQSYGAGIVHPDHHAILFDAHNPLTMYLGTDGGVFQSKDLGDSWHPINNGIDNVQFQFVDVHPTDRNIAYGGTQDNGTLKFEGEKAWPNVEAGDGGFTRVNPKHPEIVYGEYVDIALYKSINAGKDWDWGITNGIRKQEGALFYAPFNLDPENPETLVTGTTRVYRTTNGAISWTPISPPLGRPISAVTVAPNNSNVIYAGTSDGRVWVTPNIGANWYEVTVGLPKGSISDIEVDPRNGRTVYVSIATWESHSVWKSTNAGGTWRDISDNLPAMPTRCMVVNPLNPDQLFIATDVGVFFSENGEGSWKIFGKSLPNAPVFSIVANKITGYITVGTHGRGAWRIPLPN